MAELSGLKNRGSKRLWYRSHRFAPAWPRFRSLLQLQLSLLRLCARLRSPENVRDAVQDAFARLLDDTDHINLAIID